MDKYQFWVHKNYYIIRYNMRAAAILTFEKCLYFRQRLRLTTARRPSAYVVESASDDYNFKLILVCGLHGALESATVLRRLRNCRDNFLLFLLLLLGRRTVLVDVDSVVFQDSRG